MCEPTMKRTLKKNALVIDGAVGVGKSTLIQQLVKLKGNISQLIEFEGEDGSERVDMNLVRQYYENSNTTNAQLLEMSTMDARCTPIKNNLGDIVSYRSSFMKMNDCKVLITERDFRSIENFLRAQSFFNILNRDGPTWTTFFTRDAYLNRTIDYDRVTAINLTCPNSIMKHRIMRRDGPECVLSYFSNYYGFLNDTYVVRNGLRVESGEYTLYDTLVILCDMIEINLLDVLKDNPHVRARPPPQPHCVSLTKK